MNDIPHISRVVFQHEKTRGRAPRARLAWARARSRCAARAPRARGHFEPRVTALHISTFIKIVEMFFISTKFFDQLLCVVERDDG